MSPVTMYEPYHWLDTIDYLYRGGFRYGRGLVTAAAVVSAESNRGQFRLGPIDFKTMAIKPNPDGSVDRGWIMLNSGWHAEVSDEDAQDPVKSSLAFWRITEHGETFHEWSSFNAKRHLPFMEAARLATALHAVVVLGKPKSEGARIALWKGRLP